MQPFSSKFISTTRAGMHAKLAWPLRGGRFAGTKRYRYMCRNVFGFGSFHLLIVICARMRTFVYLFIFMYMHIYVYMFKIFVYSVFSFEFSGG